MTTKTYLAGVLLVLSSLAATAGAQPSQPQVIKRDRKHPYFYVQVAAGKKIGDEGYRDAKILELAGRTGAISITVARGKRGTLAVFAAGLHRTYGEAVANRPYSFSLGKQVAEGIAADPRLAASLAAPVTEKGLHFERTPLTEGDTITVNRRGVSGGYDEFARPRHTIIAP